MWRVHRLDPTNAKKPAKLLDSKSLTLGLWASIFGRFFFTSLRIVSTVLFYGAPRILKMIEIELHSGCGGDV
jgi:hypothetical protein